MNGILSVSSFCEVCSAVSRSISWARCLPVVLRNDPETKHIFSLTQLRSPDPIDPSKSQTISPAYPQMSSIA